MTMKTVCVIGLGPAGIAAVKELREQGFDVTAYDARKRIGGRWALDWSASPPTGAWKELHMNTPRHLNEFSDFPWRKEDYATTEGVEEDRHGHFPHSTEAHHYLQAYADRFDLGESMVLNTKVVKIEQSSVGTGTDWTVHTETNSNADATTPTTKQVETFHGLVLCQGRYAKGKNALVEPGGPLAGFAGEVIHGADFRSVDLASGKRVLVVGSSVSGCDIAGSLARDGTATYVDQSVRHVPYMINHLTDRGGLTDEHLFSRLVVWLNTYLPASMNQKGLKAAILGECSLQVTREISKDPQLVPDEDIGNAGVAYAYNWVKALKDEKLTLRHGIHSSEDKTVVFNDGTARYYDLVICGTGYSMDLSILPQSVTDRTKFINPWSQQTEVALYKWTLVPNMPTIAFCGAQHLIGDPFPVFEMNARWIANVFAGRLARHPPEAALERAAAEFRDFRNASPGNQYDLAIMSTEAMAEEMGLAPSKLRALWDPKRLLLSFPYACYYRTDPTRNDQTTARKAQERFDYLVTNVPTGLLGGEGQ